jgi:hypothetical protein
MSDIINDPGALQASEVVLVKDRLAAVLRPSVVVAVVCALLLTFISLARGYSAIDYVHLGTVWSAHIPSGTWGYDGQFYYQLARAPFGAYAFMDNAPYRYQHILYPLVVRALSLGQEALIPYMLLLVNWLSIVLSVEIVALLLKKRGFSPWFSLALGLYFGQAAGLTFDTAEPFTCLLVCAGLLLLDEQHLTWAALLMGLAALSRETAVLFPVGYVGFFLLRRQWKEALSFSALGLLPLAAWLAILALIFGKTGVTFTPPFERVPFAGFLSHAQNSGKFLLLLLLVILPTLGLWLLAGAELVRRRVGQVWLILLANLLVVTFLSRDSSNDLISCGRIATGLVLAGMLYAITTKNKYMLWFLQCYSITFLIFAVGIFLHVKSFLL